jgi:hypothetical protein
MAKLAERCRLAATALVEQHHSPFGRVEEICPTRIERPARAAVQDHHRRPGLIAVTAPVDRMAVADFEHAVPESAACRALIVFPVFHVPACGPKPRIRGRAFKQRSEIDPATPYLSIPGKAPQIQSWRAAPYWELRHRDGTAHSGSRKGSATSVCRAFRCLEHELDARSQSANTLPGFSIPCGSRVCLMARMVASSAGLRDTGKKARLRVPMPCSAETEPWWGASKA